MNGDREIYQAALGRLQDQRDAIDRAIVTMAALLGGQPVVAVKKVKTLAPVKQKRRPRETGTNHRDESILKALERAGGCARSEVLRKSLPSEPGLSEVQQSAAFRNAVQRLKVQGKIGRTGDTWSLAS